MSEPTLGSVCLVSGDLNDHRSVVEALAGYVGQPSWGTVGRMDLDSKYRRRVRLEGSASSGEVAWFFVEGMRGQWTYVGVLLAFGAGPADRRGGDAWGDV